MSRSIKGSFGELKVISVKSIHFSSEFDQCHLNIEHVFFDDPENVGNLLSGSFAFSKSSLNIWKFMVHILLKPGLENFEHYFTSM